MHISSSRCPFKKAVLMSMFSISQSLSTAIVINIFNVLCRETCAKFSLKLIPMIWLKPFAINLALKRCTLPLWSYLMLKTNLHGNGYTSSRVSITSKRSFVCKLVISSWSARSLSSLCGLENASWSFCGSTRQKWASQKSCGLLLNLHG